MRILVVGDEMRDAYHIGTIVRLNPEDPSSPLVTITRESCFPGGAGNVARNVGAMGVKYVDLLGGIGKIVKHRVVTEDRVVCRYDVEDELAPVDSTRLR